MMMTVSHSQSLFSFLRLILNNYFLNLKMDIFKKKENMQIEQESPLKFKL